MTERDTNSLLYHLLEELAVDERAIVILKNTLEDTPLTVRELSNKTKMNVSRIYKDIRTLENLRLIKIIDGRPLKVIKNINEQMLEKLALRARQKLLAEIENRLKVIQAFITSNVKRDLCKDCVLRPENSKSGEKQEHEDNLLTRFISLPIIDNSDQSEKNSRILSLQELKEIFAEILQQEQLNLIVPYDEFRYMKQNVITSIINTIISDSNYPKKINRLRVLLFSKKPIFEFEPITTKLTNAFKLVLQKTENIEIRGLNKFMYPTISNNKMVVIPIMCPNLELVSYLILTKSSSIINIINSQFHQHWIKASVIKTFTGEQYKEFLNQL